VSGELGDAVEQSDHEDGAPRESGNPRNPNDNSDARRAIPVARIPAGSPAPTGSANAKPIGRPAANNETPLDATPDDMIIPQGAPTDNVPLITIVDQEIPMGTPDELIEIPDIAIPLSRMPQTGDYNALHFWIASLIASLLALTASVLALYKRKKIAEEIID